MLRQYTYSHNTSASSRFVVNNVLGLCIGVVSQLAAKSLLLFISLYIQAVE
jgi:hypothetical protein